jgi:hypothetical protein
MSHAIAHIDAYDALWPDQQSGHLRCNVGNSGFILTEDEKHPDVRTCANCANEAAFFCAAHSPRA